VLYFQEYVPVRIPGIRERSVVRSFCGNYGSQFAGTGVNGNLFACSRT